MGPWTVDDAADLACDGRRFEVVDGQLIVVPMQRIGNGRVQNRLSGQLARQLPSAWEPIVEASIRLGPIDGRIADVAVVRTRLSTLPAQVGFDPTDVVLVVEVVSPSSRKTDRFFKPIEYAEAGIAAYWRIETEPEVVLHVHRLVGEAYEPVQQVRAAETVQVPFALTVDIPALSGS